MTDSRLPTVRDFIGRPLKDVELDLRAAIKSHKARIKMIETDLMLAQAELDGLIQLLPRR